MILLVANSPPLLQATAQALYREVDIATARDGEEAWDALCALPEIDVVVTELDMPLLDGYGLLARIRASSSPEQRTVPVIVLCDADPPEARHRALAAGADDFLLKPVHPIEVLARVQLHQRLSTALRELDECRQRLASETQTDPVTQLYNGRGFADHLRRAVAISLRHETPLSLLLLEIDHLTEVDDTSDDAPGLDLLADVAAWLAQAIRAEDTLARVEGARFAILAPQTGQLGAAVLAERLRAGIAELADPVTDQGGETTVSVGVATLHGESPVTEEALTAAAERRLATARALGGNQVCRRGDADPPSKAPPDIAADAPATPAVAPRTGGPPEALDDELVAQLLTTLQELTRQLGINDFIPDADKAGPPGPP